MYFKLKRIINYSITNWNRILLILLIIYGINEVLKIPYTTEAVLNKLLSQNIPVNRFEVIRYTNQKISYFNIIFQGVHYFSLCCFYSFLLFLCISFFYKNIGYIKILPVFILCESVLCLSELVNTAMNYLCGFGNTITHLNTLKIGLNIFANQSKVSEDIYLVLYAINPFLIVFFFLLVVGITEVTDLKKYKIFIIAITYTILRIIIPIMLF